MLKRNIHEILSFTWFKVCEEETINSFWWISLVCHGTLESRFPESQVLSSSCIKRKLYLSSEGLRLVTGAQTEFIFLGSSAKMVFLGTLHTLEKLTETFNQVAKSTLRPQWRELIWATSIPRKEGKLFYLCNILPRHPMKSSLRPGRFSHFTAINLTDVATRGKLNPFVAQLVWSLFPTNNWNEEFYSFPLST